MMDREEAARCRSRYQERLAVYRSCGHDREEAMRFICSQASPFETPVLEIGCGKGVTSLALARLAPFVIGLDLSAEDLSFARINLGAFGKEHRVHLVHGDASMLPFPDGSCSTLFMVNALHHLPEPRPILAEAVRVLSSGGKYILADFTPEGFGIINRVHGLQDREHARFSHSVDDAVRELEALGMECVSRAEGHQEDVAVLTRTLHTR
ncbi:MAG: class I SAM-dependent methyltransferase [bacterium]